MKCDKCNGKGLIPSKEVYLFKELCPKCKGNKELDWLEIIFGAKNIAEKLNYMINLRNYKNRTRSKLIHDL